MYPWRVDVARGSHCVHDHVTYTIIEGLDGEACAANFVELVNIACMDDGLTSTCIVLPRSVIAVGHIHRRARAQPGTRNQA